MTVACLKIAIAVPGVQASRTIEMPLEIQNPQQFRAYFEELDPNSVENDSVLKEQLTEVRKTLHGIASRECIDILLYLSIGCLSCCPGCGIKCELPAEVDVSGEHDHSTQHHLPMAFNGWPCDKALHPNLSLCYQQWTKRSLYRGDDQMSTREEFFSCEAPDWYEDVNDKRRTGEAHSESLPPLEHRRAWMVVRHRLLNEFGLQDQVHYDSGVYPTSIVSVPADYYLLWKAL